MSKLTNWTGVKRGRLTPIQYITNTGRWLCVCDCGNYVEVFASNLRKENHTRSCGCLKRELAKRFVIHGKSKTAEHNVWHSMINRCENKSDKSYYNYGGRGISVCESWKIPKGIGFINFIKDIGYKPANNYTLERIDVNGNYEPSNCKWILRSDQPHNRRGTIKVYHKGALIPLAVGLKEIGLRQNIYHSRKTRKGLNDQDAFDSYVKPIPGFISHSFGYII